MRDSKSSTSFQEAGASLLAQFKSSSAPRAVLVTPGQGDELNLLPIQDGNSLLNLETELFDHLSSKPYSSEFLQELMDYCAGRLAARAEAKATGGISTPRPKGGWNIVHVNMGEVQ